MRHVHNVFVICQFVRLPTHDANLAESQDSFLRNCPVCYPSLFDSWWNPVLIFTNWTKNLVIRQDNKLCVSILGEVGNIQWDSCQGWRDHFSPGHPIPTAMPAQKLFASHRSTALLQVTSFQNVKQMTLIPNDPGWAPPVLCPPQFQPSHRLLPHCRS